jgi:pimeloyl-ACP methyl ester carboxylesterase
MDALHRFAGPEGREIATHHLAGASPTVVFLPGLRSDMQGSKALETLAFCQKRGQAMLRLDYSGHGASSGRFEDGTYVFTGSRRIVGMKIATAGRISPTNFVATYDSAFDRGTFTLKRPDQ